MRRAGRSESYAGIGARDGSSLMAHDIGVGAGRNVYRDYRSSARIQCGDRIRVQAADGRFEACAEDGIDV